MKKKNGTSGHPTSFRLTEADLGRLGSIRRKIGARDRVIALRAAITESAQKIAGKCSCRWAAPAVRKNACPHCLGFGVVAAIETEDTKAVKPWIEWIQSPPEDFAATVRPEICPFCSGRCVVRK